MSDDAHPYRPLFVELSEDVVAAIEAAFAGAMAQPVRRLGSPNVVGAVSEVDRRKKIAELSERLCAFFGFDEIESWNNDHERCFVIRARCGDRVARASRCFEVILAERSEADVVIDMLQELQRRLT